MITLDPDFVGALAPPTKLTTAVNDTHDIPFARLPRLERLRAQGKADETELVDDDEEDAAEGDGDKNDKPQSRAEKEKRKMRGKGKSLKRYVFRIRHCSLSLIIFKTQIPPEATQKCHRSHCGKPQSIAPPIDRVLMRSVHIGRYSCKIGEAAGGKARGKGHRNWSDGGAQTICA
jgi:hypothetical protein